jgi:hypothetical protein
MATIKDSNSVAKKKIPLETPIIPLETKSAHIHSVYILRSEWSWVKNTEIVSNQHLDGAQFCFGSLATPSLRKCTTTAATTKLGEGSSSSIGVVGYLTQQ